MSLNEKKNIYKKKLVGPNLSTQDHKNSINGELQYVHSVITVADLFSVITKIQLLIWSRITDSRGIIKCTVRIYYPPSQTVDGPDQSYLYLEISTLTLIFSVESLPNGDKNPSSSLSRSLPPFSRSRPKPQFSFRIR